MYGETPDQRQYERQQRQTEGGRQIEGTQWQRGERTQPRGQPRQGGGMQARGQQGMGQPQEQQFAEAGTRQQSGSQQRMGQQGRGQQGMRQQGGQAATQRQQGRGQQGMRQQGMAQQGPPQQGMTRPQQGTTQQGMGQRGMAQQGMAQQGAAQQGMTQQARGFPSTRGVHLQSVTLEEISRSEVVTVDPDATITDVVVEMADKNVGSVVVAEDGEPKGVLTDRKIAMSLGEMPNVADRTAGEIVGEGVVTGTPGMSIYEAVQKLRDEGIRRLPIVDERGQLEGIVTLDDVMVLIAGELGAAAEVIERQAPPR